MTRRNSPPEEFPCAHDVVVCAEGAGVLSLPGTERARLFRGNTPERGFAVRNPNAKKRRDSISWRTLRAATRSRPEQRHEHSNFALDSGRSVVARASRPCVGCTIRTSGMPVPGDWTSYVVELYRKLYRELFELI